MCACEHTCVCCAHVYVCVKVHMHAEAVKVRCLPQLVSNVFWGHALSLNQGLPISLSRMDREPQASCYHHFPITQITGTHPHFFPMGSGGSNSDSQACTTITLPTGPSPQPSLLWWFCFLKSQTTFQPHEPFPGDESNPAMSFSYHMWGNWRTERELLLLKVTQRLESKLSLSHN